MPNIIEMKAAPNCGSSDRVLGVLDTASEALLTALVLCGSLTQIIGGLLDKCPSAHQFAMLNAMQACIDKVESAVRPALEDTSGLFDDLKT